MTKVRATKPGIAWKFVICHFRGLALLAFIFATTPLFAQDTTRVTFEGKSYTVIRVNLSEQRLELF